MMNMNFFKDVAERSHVDLATLETDRDTRRVLTAIGELVGLESKIEQCKTIGEVEEIRARCQGIQYYAREKGESFLGANIVAWAKRVAVLCQLRITLLQEEAKAKRNGLHTSTSVSTLTRSESNRRGEAKLVASLPPAELQKHLESSGSIQMIARKVRRERNGNRDYKHSAELRAKKSEIQRRYRARKAKDKTKPMPVVDKYANRDEWTSTKFEKYWPQEERLLAKSFNTTDFEKLEPLWLRAFQSYRTEAEAAKQERDSALARLRTKTPSDSLGGNLDEVKVN